LRSRVGTDHRITLSLPDFGDCRFTTYTPFAFGAWSSRRPI
jgi:hypothetical protein